jgi:hypothetical protein
MDLGAQAALLTAELVVLVACAVIALPVPAQLPLLLIALISYTIRRKPWSERWVGGQSRALVGATMGAVALAIAVAIGPVLEAQTGGLVGWTRHGIVRGKVDAFVTFAMIVAALAVATEIIMRGWILERIRELVSGRIGVAIAIAVTAAIEAIFTGDPGWSSLGAALVSAALSALYLAGGRSLVAPVAARLTFELGVLVLEGLKLVG